MRAWRTKELPLSAAIPCPQAAHYIGAAKRVAQRSCDGRVVLLSIRCKRRHLLCLLRHDLPLTRLLQKSEPPRAILLPNSGGEENQTQSVSDCWVFLNLTEFSYRSTRKKDFIERFFAKRSGERFKRGVRLRRTTRRLRSAATMSVQKEIRETRRSLLW